LPGFGKFLGPPLPDGLDIHGYLVPLDDPLRHWHRWQNLARIQVKLYLSFVSVVMHMLLYADIGKKNIF
jgi:hypothetical protein